MQFSLAMVSLTSLVFAACTTLLIRSSHTVSGGKVLVVKLLAAFQAPSFQFTGEDKFHS